MTVGELKATLEQFDEDMKVVVGMQQTYGSNFAKAICDDVARLNIRAFYGNDYEAVVLTEGGQVGTVDYDD